MKKLATLLLLIAVVATAIPVAVADAGTDSYIVRMEGAPLIAYEGDLEGMPATKPASGDKISLNSAPAMQYRQYLEASHNQALEGAGVKLEQKVHTYVYALNGFSAFMTEAQAAEMAKQPGVIAVMPDEMRYPTQDSETTSLTVTDPAKQASKGYDGSGVVVGIIDTGIWPEHPSFADDGSYGPSPVGPIPCEFGNTAHNPHDAPFACNNKLIGARQMLATYRALIGAEANEYDSARDDGGHGTHTASTAAGNAGVRASIYGIPRGKISGIAPRAHVVAYKGLGFLGGFTSDLAAAIDQAVADGVDVINYSIGGGAAGPGADEIAFLFAADAGVYVATSAGNSGPGAATLGNPGTMPWMTTVGADTPKRFFQGTIKLGDGDRYYGASITAGTRMLPLVDAADYGNELCDPAQAFTDDVSGKIVLCRRGATARADKSRAVSMAGGAGMIMYNTDDVGNLATDSHWVPSVHIDQTPGLAIKAYIASEPAPEAMIHGGRVSTWPYAPSMTKFSSRGPNPISPDIIKPDISANGTQILAGYSPTSYEVYDLPGELFAAIQGTSMSSPIVAGTFALLKQAHPDWSPAMARSAIMTTADQDVVDNDRISPADPFAMGAGHLNIGDKKDRYRTRSYFGNAASMAPERFRLNSRAKRNSIFQPGLAYDAGLFDYAAYTCGEDFGVFTPGSCDYLASLGIPSDPSDLNYPSIAIAELAGSQTVQRTVTSVAKEKGWREYQCFSRRSRWIRGDGFTFQLQLEEWRVGDL